MGEKGTKSSALGAHLANEVLLKLAPIGGISTKKMFGGSGIFHEEKMFAIVTAIGDEYKKVDGANRSTFEKAGSEKHSKMPYFSVPGKVLNSAELVDWAKRSIAINE